MKKEKALKKLKNYPEGSHVIYNNPGKRGHGNKAEVKAHLSHSEGKQIHGCLLKWADCKVTTVTVNQIRNYYLPAKKNAHVHTSPIIRHKNSRNPVYREMG